MSDEILPAGQSVGQYRIVSLIGSGGMGHVYLAEDRRLGRRVALKVLPSEYTRDRGRLARFEQEAKSSSALNHPAILTIHDFGRDAEVYYIATEFIEGETLRTRMRRGNMKLNEVLEIAVQVSSALVASHAHGIVHRDLKPENIMVRPDGFVKVLDFGLAKLTQQGPADEMIETATVPRNATDAGTVLGTAQYMSPEQAKGRPVDARSDIFSLGVVLYEMITGHVPFEGETRSHVVVSILEREPLPLSRWTQGIPQELQRMVSKMLAKSVDDRYQVIKDVLIDLKSLRHEVDVQSGSAFQNYATPPPDAARTSGSGASPTASGVSSAEYIMSGIRSHKKSIVATIAVAALIALGAIVGPMMVRNAEGGGVRLPIAVADFENLTGEKELDGLSGMMITSLEQSKRLSVMTRSRMFDVLRQNGRADAARIDETLGREVARAENLQALVTATVQKFGELYILDLKVLDPAKNEYIFTAKEEGKGKENIPAMIDRLSEKMRLGLREKEHDVAATKTEIGNVTTRNLEAYQHYFIGEQHIGEIEPGKATDELKKAVKLDPTFALAHYRLAYALNWMGSTEAIEHINRAMQFIEQAPEKEKLYIRALKANVDRDTPGALAIYRQIIRQYPDEKEAIYNVGDLSHHACDYVAAEQHLRKAIALDPLFERAHQHLCWSYRNQERYTEMIAPARDYVQRIGSGDAYENLALAYFFSRDRTNFEATIAEGLKRHPDSPELIGWELFYTSGATLEASRRRLQLATDPARRAFIHFAIFSNLAELGRAREALEEADAGIAEARKSAPAFIPDFHAAKASLLARNGEFDEARVAIARALEGHPSSAGYRDLFFAFSELGELEKVTPFLPRVAAGSPHFLHILEASKAYNRKDFKRAAAELEAARQLNGYLFPSFRLAETYIALGEPDKALRLLESRRGLKASGELLLLEAKAYEAKGDRVRARQKIGEVFEIWEDSDTDTTPYVEAKNLRARLAG